MHASAISDIGKVRTINEDKFCITKQDYDLFIVADGMGGHNAGEVASDLAINKVKKHISKYISIDMEAESIKGIIYESFNRANNQIYKQSNENKSWDGMGTTLTMALKINSTLYIGHVGDSRLYIIKDNKIEQITQDHSLVAELVRSGNITEVEARKHPQKNIITRALGTNKDIKVDIFSVEFNKLDVLILCTDGLSNFVDIYEIENTILEFDGNKEACERLVYMANQRGGFDNITVLIARNNETNIESR